MFGFGRKKQLPAGPDGGPKGTMYPPAGDRSTHAGRASFDGAPSRQMRAFDDSEQPPIGPVYVDPRHNLYMPTRFAEGWFGGLIPNQPLPDWSLVAQANTTRFHAPLTDVQVKDRSSRSEKGKGTLFPSAVVNPPQYLRHGGTVPIGIGPEQIQQFHVATDAMHVSTGNGPGSTYPNVPFMAGGYAAGVDGAGGSGFAADT